MYVRKLGVSVQEMRGLWGRGCKGASASEVLWQSWEFATEDLRGMWLLSQGWADMGQERETGRVR